MRVGDEVVGFSLFFTFFDLSLVDGDAGFLTFFNLLLDGIADVLTLFDLAFDGDLGLFFLMSAPFSACYDKKQNIYIIHANQGRILGDNFFR